LPRVSPGTVVAVFALAVSFFTLLWSVVQFRRTQREARRPVLVFVYQDGLWTLVNTGAGPALDVVVALWHEGRWFTPVRMMPMARRASQALTWVRDYNGRGLAATCKDTSGDVYTTVSYDDRNFVVDGSQIPEWDDESIERHWRVIDWASLAHDREGPFPFETH
jgi:hypothetical protein